MCAFKKYASIYGCTLHFRITGFVCETGVEWTACRAGRRGVRLPSPRLTTFVVSVLPCVACRLLILVAAKAYNETEIGKKNPMPIDAVTQGAGEVWNDLTQEGYGIS